MKIHFKIVLAVLLSSFSAKESIGMASKTYSQNAEGLNQAIYDRDVAEVKKILGTNPSLINEKAGEYNETPLIRVVSHTPSYEKTKDDKEIFDYLMTFQVIDINALDKSGYTALDYVLKHYAFNINDEVVVELLLHMCGELLKRSAQYPMFIADHGAETANKILSEVRQKIAASSAQEKEQQLIEHSEITAPEVQDTSITESTEATVEETAIEPSEPSQQAEPTEATAAETEKECSICLDTINPQEETQLTCGHSFHESCISDWFEKSQTCPLCRKSFSTEETTEPSTTAAAPTPPAAEFAEPNFDGNYYEILGIAADASSATIKKAYYKLARVHHPDKGGDEEKFKKISIAYATLSDAGKRAEYDQSLKSAPTRAPAAPSPTAPSKKPAASAAPSQKPATKRKKAARRKKGKAVRHRKKAKGRKKATQRKHKKAKNRKSVSRRPARKKASRSKRSGRRSVSRRKKAKKARNFDYEEALKKRSTVK